MKLFIPVLLAFLISTFCLAQQNNQLKFKKLTHLDGLSNNIVQCILQDREGFMWFGTIDGLNKYDGYSFTVFKPDPLEPENTLRGSNVSAIHEDKLGRLWIGTQNGGLQQINKRTGNITAFPIDTSKFSRWNEVYTISEDRQGMLWLGTSLGLVKFNPVNGDYTKYLSHGIKGNYLMASVHQDPEGKFWAFNNNGIFRLDPHSGIYIEYKIDAFPPEQQPFLYGFQVDEKGIAWVGTRGEGIFCLNTKNPAGFHQFNAYNPGIYNKKNISQFGLINDGNYIWIATTDGLERINKITNEIVAYQSDPKNLNSLGSNEIHSVYKDRNNNIWVGAGNGINKAETANKPFLVQQIIPTPSSFYHPENYIADIAGHPNGKIYLSCLGDMYSYDLKRNKIEKFQNNAPYGFGPIHISQKHKFWFGANMEQEYALGLLDLETNNIITYQSKLPVVGLSEDKNGKLWIRGWSGQEISSFNPVSKKFSYYTLFPDSTGPFPANVSIILGSQSGAIWVGSDIGLSRLDPETGKLKHFFQNKGDETGLLNDSKVKTIFEDPKSTLWIGTSQGGLNRLDPETNTFTYFTTKDGLPSNSIESIISDEKGNLWISTSHGLSRFNPVSKKFKNFDILDGLPDNRFAHDCASRVGNRLAIGTRNGFIVYHPDSIKDEVDIPPVYLTGLKIFEKTVPLPEDKLKLSHQDNFLSFDFVGLNFNTPEKVQYAYKMEGVDNNWIYSGSRRFASYTSIAPGQYKFQVKSSNDGMLWNEEAASLNILIHPPWWRTSWAFLGYGFVFLIFIFLAWQDIIRRERLRANLRIKQVEADKLKDIDQLKSRFFANISHEFRTPLTLILGPLKTFISRTSIEDPDKSVYQMMLRNADRLHHLINQLLDLSKLEAGNMKVEPRPADIISFLKALVYSFTSHAESKQISYNFLYPEENSVVYFDLDKLEKVIVNLLSNAFKFTPPDGKVTITVSYNCVKGKALPSYFNAIMPASPLKLLEIKVEDSGIGIAKDKQDKIFDRFYQIDTSQTREKEGSGIGLSLVKELVELLYGEIKVESNPGHGTCFIVNIPVMVPNNTTETTSATQLKIPLKNQDLQLYFNDEEKYSSNQPTEAANTEPPMVLIIEDNADVRYFIRENLHLTYQVIEAENGLQGFELAVQAIPDLILSDIMMPKMDGVELCQRLKSNEKTAHIPVILLTARASGEHKKEGLEKGADDYLIKPFEADELLVRIKNLIENRKKLREIFSREIILHPTAQSITSADELFLQRVMKILKTSISDASFGVEELGREAGMSRMQLFRKLKALTTHSPGEFIRLIRLKSAAELLSGGAGSIAEIAFLVGFSDPSYFTKCFQKQYGRTPSEYIASKAKLDLDKEVI